MEGAKSHWSVLAEQKHAINYGLCEESSLVCLPIKVETRTQESSGLIVVFLGKLH